MKHLPNNPFCLPINKLSKSKLKKSDRVFLLDYRQDTDNYTIWTSTKGELATIIGLGANITHYQPRIFDMIDNRLVITPATSGGSNISKEFFSKMSKLTPIKATLKCKGIKDIKIDNLTSEPDMLHQMTHIEIHIDIEAATGYEFIKTTR